MHWLYLEYSSQFDKATRTYCVTGTDRAGNLFGVGAGLTVEEAEIALRDYILEVFETQAATAVDGTVDLATERPETPHLVFSPAELFPIRLRRLRAEANLRQSDMAQRMGITQQAYAKLERPGANPRLRTLLQAEQALESPLLNWS